MLTIAPPFKDTLTNDQPKELSVRLGSISVGGRKNCMAWESIFVAVVYSCMVVLCGRDGISSSINTVTAM